MKFPDNMPSLSVFKGLYPKQYEPLIKAYLKWITLLAYRGFKQKHTSDKSFNLLYKAVGKQWQENRLLGYLQKEFIKENLSLSLLLEPLDGFEWLSKNRYPLELSVSSPILLQIMTPFARLIAAVNHQHPPFYQPFSNLICAYFWLYLSVMPEAISYLNKMSITLNSEKMISDLPLLHKEALQVLPVINGIFFRIKIAFYLGLCRVLIKRTQTKRKKIMFVNAILYGLWYLISIRRKSIRSNRIRI